MTEPSFVQPPSPSPLVAPGPPPPPAPRPVPSGVGGWNTSFALIWGGGYGGIPALVLLLLLYLMGPPWHDTILDQRGVLAQATPYAVEGTGVEVNEQDMQRVRARFVDRKGRPHEVGLTTVDEALLARAGRHEPLDIDYDPENPELARFHGGRASLLSGDGAWVIPMMLIVFVIPGLSSLAWGLISLQRRRSLYRHGVPVVAAIVEHTQSASSENDEYLINARYEFSSPQGMHSGVIKALQPPPVGARIWVLYAQESPDRSVPV